MRKELDVREDKTALTDSFIQIAECVLKNNIFEHKTFFQKQSREAAIGTKAVPPDAIQFMGDLEEKRLKDSDKKPPA